MPAKSQAQFGWAGAAFRRGEISRETLEEFNRGVHPKELPKRVTPLEQAAHRRATYRKNATPIRR